MKLALSMIGLAGAVLFGFALAVTFLSPVHVERAARGFIENQIERDIRDRLSAFQVEGRGARISRFAGALAERHSEEIRALRDRLAEGLNAQIAVSVGRMQDLNCECRQQMLQVLDAATRYRLSTLERAEPQLRRIIEGRYGEIVADLLRDLRIFTAANLLAFLLLLALSFLKPGHVRQLFVPGILLGVTALSASAIYLFGQNWFFTLLYGDFTGWAYVLWMALIYAFLLDVAVFKARVTNWIVNGVGGLLSSAPVPC